MRGRGLCVAGGCEWQGGMHNRGACMAGGVHGGGLHGGGLHGGGAAWQEMCMAGGVYMTGGCARWGACVVGACIAGSMHGRGTCMSGDGVWQGGCACHTPPRQILWDTANERAVRILLECILLFSSFGGFFHRTVHMIDPRIAMT